MRIKPCFAFVSAVVVIGTVLQNVQAHQDGQFPPPLPPVVQWDDLLAGNLAEHWSDVNTAIKSPTYTLKVDPDNAKGQVLVLGRRPTGLLRSMKAYENFILECEWRHLTEAPSAAGGKDTTGNSGLYVWADPLPTVGGTFTRAVEVQVCNLGNGAWYTSHGDLFPISGATMIPDPRFGISGNRSMPLEFRGKKTGEWNHIRVTCVDGTIQEEVNGALVTAGFRSSPRKGYLHIESEGGPIEFRNMHIHELPGVPELKAGDIAQLLPEGTRTTCLYNGVNLDGWSVAEDQKDLWKASDHVLQCDGKKQGNGLDMALPNLGGTNLDFTLQIDWMSEQYLPFVLEGCGTLGPPSLLDVKKGWNRAVYTYHDSILTLTVNGQKAGETGAGPAGNTAIRLKNPGHPTKFSNIILIEPNRH